MDMVTATVTNVTTLSDGTRVHWPSRFAVDRRVLISHGGNRVEVPCSVIALIADAWAGVNDDANAAFAEAVEVDRANG
jgi:hypothetical protein